MTGLFAVSFNQPDGKVAVLNNIYPSAALAEEDRKALGGDRVLEIMLLELKEHN